MTAGKIFLWLLLLLLLLSLVGGWLMFCRAFRPQRDARKTEIGELARMRRGPLADRADFVRQGREWLDEQPCQHLYMTNRDGLQLHARYFFTTAAPRGRTLLMAHGYHSCGSFDFGCGCPFYLSLGYDLCVIDQRAHGLSQGRAVCFGVRESVDVVDWCNYLLQRQPRQQLVLAGISMGATTCLLAAARDDLPPQVLGVIADCGFISCYEQFCDVLHSMRLPRFPLLPLAQMFCRVLLGFGFSDHSTLDAVGRMRLPVIFFHGADDDFVPLRHSQQNYAACLSPRKQLVIVPGAGHGQSFIADQDGCRARLSDFLRSL